MFEIDKKQFGEFLAQQRKAKGYTQKELADKLYVSDKAVSKWERALSMPDISLLMPLAEILEVSVTELLEGRKLDASAGMDASHVESLVKMALTFSEDTPEKKKSRQKKHAVIFGGCTLLAVMELTGGIWLLHILGISSLSTNLLLLEGLGFFFGIYFWFFMPERLPTYYDENKISGFCDGFFRMNIPGLHFNNCNWKPILNYLRIWSVASMLAVPVPCFLLSALDLGFWWVFGIQNAFLLAYLLGLFLPVYIIGKKYEDGADGSSNGQGKGRKGHGEYTGSNSEYASGNGEYTSSNGEYTSNNGEYTSNNGKYTNCNGQGKDRKGHGSESVRRSGKRLWLPIILFLLILLLPLGFSVSGILPFRSGIQVNYVSEGGRQEWSARYSRLDGTLTRNLYPGSDPRDYVIEVDTQSGSLAIELRDSLGNIVFAGEELQSGSYPLTLTGTLKVLVSAADHKGGFSIMPQ